jgi:hypothetical protein
LALRRQPPCGFLRVCLGLGGSGLRLFDLGLNFGHLHLLGLLGGLLLRLLRHRFLLQCSGDGGWPDACSRFCRSACSLALIWGGKRLLQPFADFLGVRPVHRLGVDVAHQAAPPAGMPG